MSQNKASSFEAAKGIYIYTIHLIQNKLTLLRNKVKSYKQWECAKVRTSEMSKNWCDRIQLLELFELFGYLLNDIEKQETLYTKMREKKWVLQVLMAKLYNKDSIGEIHDY